MKLLAQSHKDENPCPEDLPLNLKITINPSSNSPNPACSKFMQLSVHSYIDLGWFHFSYVFLNLAFLASEFSYQLLMQLLVLLISTREDKLGLA